VVSRNLRLAAKSPVPGESAQNYNFTSALPVQILKNLAPELSPYIDPLNARACAGPAATRVTADRGPSVAQSAH